MGRASFRDRAQAVGGEPRPAFIPYSEHERIVVELQKKHAIEVLELRKRLGEVPGASAASLKPVPESAAGTPDPTPEMDAASSADDTKRTRSASTKRTR